MNTSNTYPVQLFKDAVRHFKCSSRLRITFDIRTFARHLIITSSAVTISLIMAACGSPERVSLTQSASGCALESSDSPQTAGKVPITAVNDTDIELLFHLWRIAGGHTFEEFAAHIDEEIRLAAAGEDGLGPPSYAVDLIELRAQPGQSEIQVELSAGTYAIVCFEEYAEVGWRPSALVGPLQLE